MLHWINSKNSEDIGIDQFFYNVTIASFCNLLYRRNFMPQNSIAIIPENGYYPEKKQSRKALIWTTNKERKLI